MANVTRPAPGDPDSDPPNLPPNLPPSLPPSLDDIEALARRALEGLPEDFAQHLGDIVFRVDEFPTDDVLDDLDLESPFELMGLYQGVDLASKSVSDPAAEPDMIFLYRRPLLDYWCETGEALDHLVRHVVIHEIGHHFGLSDDDMEAVEAAADAEDDAEGDAEGPRDA